MREESPRWGCAGAWWARRFRDAEVRALRGWFSQRSGARDVEGSAGRPPSAQPRHGVAPAVGILSALGSRLSALGSRLSALGSRLSALGSRLSALGSRLSALGSRLSALGSRLSALGSRLSALGSRLSALGSRLSALSLILRRAQGPRIAARRRSERVAPPRAQPGNRELRQCPRGRQLPPVGCRLTPAGPEERAGALSSRNRQSRCHLPSSSVSFARTARGRSVIARNCPLPGIFGTYHAVERRRDVPTSFGTLVIRWRSLPIVECPVNPQNPAPDTANRRWRAPGIVWQSGGSSVEPGLGMRSNRPFRKPAKTPASAQLPHSFPVALRRTRRHNRRRRRLRCRLAGRHTPSMRRP